MEQIHRGKRGEKFNNFIKNFITFNNNEKSILIKTNLYQDIIEYLLTENSLKYYDRALTTKYVNENNNYELFELLGDSSIDKFLNQYARKKFPQLEHSQGVDILSKIKNKYRAKTFLANLSNIFGFQPYITYTEDKWNIFKTTILEDCFESMIGVTEFLIEKYFQNKYTGIGYIFIYRLLEEIFSKYQNITIQYEELVDAKIRIAELKDFLKKNNQTQLFENYIQNKETKKFTYKYIFGTEVVGQYEAMSKKQAKEFAAKKALITLKDKYGIEKTIPDRYLTIFE